MSQANTVVVLDFETTGLSPYHGDRPIEVGGVRLEDGKVTARFQQLMNPGRRISGFIEDYTGITNDMLKDAPSCSEVMRDFAGFIDGYNLVAHNASFDKRFLDAELHKIRQDYSGQFVCSMLVARRLYQTAPNHKLGTLIDHTNIPVDGDFHRALYDSEMTTKLWMTMLGDIAEQSQVATVPIKLVQKLTRTPKKDVYAFLRQWK